MVVVTVVCTSVQFGIGDENPLLRALSAKLLVPLARLPDPRLHKALGAVHAEPAHAWTLKAMAAEAGMLRARFAAHFTQVLGVPPGEPQCVDFASHALTPGCSLTAWNRRRSFGQ